ncbi:hypothetical protein JYU34_013024 [Plutella xylostella]|uniref:WH2 domain-containing protein n=1 Tax=Plutella xylostella TaxID=51655 RepID=A0ABQ7QCS9_PLUXY|nr:hypothetical protein JYU34_013024 [Plutella xylostella]
MEGIYKINLVSSDLGTEETILQIADTLEHLDAIVDEAFSRLMIRINKNVEKTNDFKQRIDIAKEKVSALTGIQKAIKVFSSAKYPAAIKHEPYESVFGPDTYKHQPAPVALSRRTQGRQNDKEIHEKLHFYHVKVGQPKTQAKPKLDLQQTLKSASTVGELLVFNTDECPYLSSSGKAVSYRPVVSAERKEQLEAAPSSILNREVLKRDVDEYMYAPGMGMVPELDVPLDLPDLPNIAGDIQYSHTLDTAIAPSAVTSPVSPPPPEVAPEVVAELPDLKLTDELSAVRSDIPDAPPSVAMATAAPPPPPPPPPPPAPLPPAPADNRQDTRAPPPPPMENPHANLMAAIRQAGGAGKAKLRSAANEPGDKDDKKPASGGDLMADLHAKLSMRRRGISGAERGGSVLHTLASVIPEPDHSSPQHSSTDDDWE